MLSMTVYGEGSFLFIAKNGSTKKPTYNGLYLFVGKYRCLGQNGLVGPQWLLLTLSNGLSVGCLLMQPT